MKQNHNTNEQATRAGMLHAVILALCVLLSIARAAFAATGTSAEFKIDLGLDGVRQSDGLETLVYSSAWDGGVGATVTIAQDGVPLVEGLAGNGEWAWSVSRNGTYVLTHTTYTNGVVAKVASATFVIATAALIPSLDPTADAAAVNEAVDGVGFADAAAVKAAIGGSAAEYAAFKAWAESVKAAGSGSMGSSRPTIILSVTVKDGENSVAVSSEKVKAMFEATSDVTDWSGAAKLTPEVVVEEGDGEPMRFKVTPGDGTVPSAFLRIRK